VTFSGFLRVIRYTVAILLTLTFAAGVIGATWYFSESSTSVQREEAIQRANATVSGLAVNYDEQITRHILALDQTLADMARDWEADPRRFDLETSRARAKILTGISRDMFLADENGIIRQASVSDFLGQNVSNLDAFRDAAEHANDKPKLYLGGAAVNPIMRQWHLDAARTLHHPDGSFAGIIDADYRMSAINDVFTTASPPGNGFAALINLTDGKMRAVFGSAGGTPDSSIADTPMFAAVDGAETGLWVGPSATDAVGRIHAFRRVPGRDLAIIVGVDQEEVLRPVVVWQRQTRAFSGAITALTLMISVLLLNVMRAGRRRLVRAREAQARFATATALAEVSRAQADAVARRLQATFSAVMDGVAIFDPHLNLVEWNGLFPERSGVNASFVRTGMPMEDVLRTQAQQGYFGAVTDIEAEVDRRTTLLRAGNFGASQSFQAHDRSIELRCRPLAEGGFVALYTDVTDARRARQALRDARESLGREQSDRMRFLGVIAFEMRARVAVLMRSVSRLHPAEPAQAQAVKRARGVGETLASLATDVVEVPVMEAGGLRLKPALVAVRTLLQEVVDTIQPEAQEHGITVYLVVNEAAPAELIADPDRIRQVMTLLLSEAVRTAAPDTMWLLADAGDGEREALRLTIRGFGSPIPEAERAGRFPSINEVAVPDQAAIGADSAVAYAAGVAHADAVHVGVVQGDAAHADVVYGGGTFLGPAIARHLSMLMGGDLRCAGWSTMDGRTGNDFILSLPPDLLPGQRGRAPGQAPVEGRPLPRTRVLLIGDPTGLRMAAVTMLRRDGHMVEAAASADEAVPMLENAPYDVVFMDAVPAGGIPSGNIPSGNIPSGNIPSGNVPFGKSVETAIATIRDMSGPARDVPLIVLAPEHDEITARGWREAGADDIMAQDPTLEDLAGAIGRNVWLSRTFAQGMGFMPGLEEEMEEGIPILAAGRIAELKANIPVDDLLDMVEECIADLFHRLPAFRRSLDAGAPGAITAHTHAMVGMAAGYGMAVLEARLRAILTAVRARRLDTIDGAAEVVEADLTRAAGALRRALRHTQTARSGAKT
jgi:signal transduction histidine kinase/DNA-binding NarL/FixJ family response regulator